MQNADVIRAAALGVRLEVDEPLVTDWRRRYADLARVHYEQGGRVAWLEEVSRRRLLHCRVLYGITACAVVAEIVRWWR